MKPPLRIHPTKSAALLHAREMRGNSTEAERKLWAHLRGRQLQHCKFRRQCVIAPFIVDFCCHEKKLVIEVDGSQHFADQNYDDERSRALGAMGYRVLRFWNSDVLVDITGVLAELVAALEKR